MKKFAKTIVDLRYAMMLLFVAAAAVCGWAMTQVNTNYDIVSYLPESTDTVQTLAKMEEQFGAVGTAQLVVKIPADEVNALKKKLENIEHMQTVVAGTDEASYKDGWALFKLFLTKSSFSPEAKEVVDNVRTALDGYEIAMNGGAVSSKFLQTSIVSDMIVIMIVACLVIAVILLLTSTSWIDPLIFAIVVAVSLLINLGTNAILKEVSFITKAICAIMQLALAMDYSIILLHRFNEERERTLDVKEAMVNAIAGSFTSVAASSLTTIAGLVALMFMRFTIGLDVGIVLTKGIVISLLSVFFFMPGVILLFAPAIRKTQHKTLQQLVGVKAEARHAKKQARFDAAARSGEKPKKAMTYVDFAFKARKVVPLILVALLVGGAVMNFNVDYSYQLKTSKNPDDAVNVENKKIEDLFGKQNSLVVLVPTGDLDKEKEVVDFMRNYEYNGKKVVNGAQGMAALGFATKIPTETLKKYLEDKDVGELLNQCGFSADADSIRIYDIIRIVSKAGWKLEGISPNDEMSYLSAWVQRVLQSVMGVLDLVGDVRYDPQMLSEALTDSLAPISSKITIPEPLVAALYEKCGFTATGGATIKELLTAFSENDVTAELFPEGGAIASLIKTAVDAVVPLIPKLHTKMTTAEYAELLPVDGIKKKLDTLFSVNGKEKASVYELIGMFAANGLPGSIARGSLIDIVKPTVALAFKMFESGNATEPMSRLMFNLDMPTASDDSFAAMKEITVGVRAIYGDQKVYIACETAAYADIKENFLLDSTTINLISFFAIFLIVAISFLSLGVPAILTVLIQGATWLGMAMQFIAGNSVFFVCYLVVMCIQMGATVDYAILLTNRYIECRYRKNRVDAMKEAFGTSVMTVMTSGSILVIAAFIVGMVSKVAIVADLGVMLSIGCLVSLCIILFALPEVLFCLDKLIEKTSIRKKGKHFLKDGETAAPTENPEDDGQSGGAGDGDGAAAFEPAETGDSSFGLTEVAGSGAPETDRNAPTLCGLPEIR